MWKLASFFQGRITGKARDRKQRAHGRGKKRSRSAFHLEELEQRLVPTLVVDPLNPRYLMDNTTGKIVYLAGSSTWNNQQSIANSPFGGYSNYINYLQSNGNNFFRLWVFESSKTSLPIANFAMEAVTPTIYARSKKPGANDGGNKFDLTQFNQAFFDEMRQDVITAGNAGIYVAVTLFNGWSVQQKGSYQDPWPYHYYNQANNINGINGDPNHLGNGTLTDTLSIPAVTALREAYVRKVVDTLHDLPNVIYEIANEPDGGAAQTAWQDHFVDYVHNYEQSTYGFRQPVLCSVEYPAYGTAGQVNADLFASNAELIAPNPAAPSPYNYQFSPPPATGAKIIVGDTDHLGSHTYSDAKFVWRNFAMGEYSLYMDTYNNSYFSGAHSLQLVKNMGYAVAYAGRMNLAADTPQPGLSSTGYCLADASATTPEYFVYLPSGGSATVNLSATTQTLNVEWFDPTTDTTKLAGTITGGGTLSFTSPFGGTDAVLFLSLPAATTVPAAPTNVTASAGNGQVSLTWTASSGAASYDIYRSTTSGGEGSKPYKTGVTGTSFTDTGLTNGTKYFYQVTAVNSAGQSPKSVEVSATPTASAPSAPTGLAASAGDTQIALTWNAVTGASSYNIYRSTTSGGEGPTPIKTGVTTASFTDTGLTNGTMYYYEVTAVNSAGESGKSAEVSATPQATTYTSVIAIDAGGGASGNFVADTDWSQNVPDTGSTTHAIDTSGVTNPAPQAVYQTWRSGTFTYTIPNLTAGGQYLVRLHFSEDWVSQVGQRVFNVAINGTQVLTNFDIIAAAGAEYKAIVKEFTVSADSNGKIAVAVTTVVGNGRINGIEILAASPVMLAGTPRQGAAVAPLTLAQLDRTVVEALRDWTALGLSAGQRAGLQSAHFEIAALPGAILGETAGNEILINRDAAGYGWSLGSRVAPHEADLLTVVCHELGHLIGLPDVNASSHPGDVMDDTLPLGVRRLPTTADIRDASIITWLQGEGRLAHGSR